MKRIFSIIAAFIILSGNSLRADEGMWLLSLINQLNINKMHDMGCKLTAEDIYSINKSSLKDAVIIFGSGCSGEIVSDKGLILTNHHCGYEAIQYHSSIEHDYLSNGYWAKSFEDELPTPNLSATFLIKIEDVTDKVMPLLKGRLTEEERETKIEEISDKIKLEAIEGTNYRASVTSFFGGNNYYLLVYEVYTDIRLVGTPPSSIGKFGGDTDNWMWPRHTGDFSVFRIYASPEGKPAPYSTQNVPLKPKRFLPVSIKGVEKNDFTMILGYPGNTDRYMTSSGVQELIDIVNPDRIKIRGTRQEILFKDMMADPSIRIKYASKYSESSNYWKYSIGQNRGLNTLKVVEKKKVQEDSFRKWLNADPDRKTRYYKVLPSIEEAITARKQYFHAMQYINEAFFQSTEILGLASQYFMFYNVLTNEPDSLQKIRMMGQALRMKTKEHFKDYSLLTDKKVASAMFKIYYDNVDKDLHPGFYKEIQKKYKGNYEKFTGKLYNKSIFSDEQKLMAYLDNPKAKALVKDPVFMVTVSIANTYFSIYGVLNEFERKIEHGNRQYIAGILEMDSTKVFYPDANFSMRMTYGKVGDYFPRDAVHYNYYTTLKGIMEKEDSTNWEFVVPAKLKELYKSKDYGRYGSNGEIHVGFTTNNDITGGNSGSPVINANGELVGLAFDGNWEAMSGDIIYEPDIQKTICVDIRYVLFIIDKFAGSKRLVDEMKIAE